MAHALDADLRAILNGLAKSDPGVRLSFIITVRPGARPAPVMPFPIEHSFDAIGAVSGQMTAQEVLDLANHSEIERIEYDGQLYALRSRLGRSPA